MSELGEIFGAVVVGGVLATIGKGIQPSIPQRWEWWHRTLWLHPMIGGVLIYQWGQSVPVPAGMGEGQAGRILWGAFAGIFAVPFYELARRILERKAEK